MIFPLRSKAIAFMGIAASMAFSSCNDDNENAAPKYEVPTTYNFQNVNYSGQQTRIAMLDELNTYIRTGNSGALLDAQKMKHMYANTNAPFASAELNTSGKNLKDKTLLTAQPVIEGYLDAVANASISVGAPAVPGISAGILTSSADATKKYLVDANGVEFGQLIQKGIMGTVFYYQVVDHYLTAEEIGSAVDNTTVKEGEGTAMEHHWDEAFGYFGVPKDFPTNTTGVKYWGSYTRQVDPAIGSNKKLMDAFLKGRAAISAKDNAGKDAAAAQLRTEWERLVVSAAIHELNAATKSIADQAVKCHLLSEAKGFLLGLKSKSDRKITDAQYNEVMAKLGTNFYNTTGADVAAAIDLLSGVYGLDSIKASL
jgi:hypothetical protein